MAVQPHCRTRPFPFFVILNLFQDNKKRSFGILKQVQDNPIRKRPAEAGRTIVLLAKAELRDECRVTVTIDFFQVIQKRTTLVDHLKKTTTRMIVLVVVFKVAGQRIDTVSQDCNLHFW
jgi:hypothetical protein